MSPGRPLLCKAAAGESTLHRTAPDRGSDRRPDPADGHLQRPGRQMSDDLRRSIAVRAARHRNTKRHDFIRVRLALTVMNSCGRVGRRAKLLKPGQRRLWAQIGKTPCAHSLGHQLSPCAALCRFHSPLCPPRRLVGFCFAVFFIGVNKKYYIFFPILLSSFSFSFSFPQIIPLLRLLTRPFLSTISCFSACVLCSST